MIKKSLVLILGMSVISGTALAATKTHKIGKVEKTSEATSEVAIPANTNVDVSTNLILKEIAKKQAELELKRINFEMQKMDLEIQEKLNKNKPSGGGSGGNGIASLPALLPPPTTTPTVNPILAQTPKDNLSKYKISSIYGFDGQLTAEIVTPAGDTNIVKVGSVLGDGVVVASIGDNSVTLRDKLNRDYILGVSSLSASAVASASPTTEPLSDLVNNFKGSRNPPARQITGSDYYKDTP